jgi:hypothetical protein
MNFLVFNTKTRNPWQRLCNTNLQLREGVYSQTNPQVMMCRFRSCCFKADPAWRPAVLRARASASEGLPLAVRPRSRKQDSSCNALLRVRRVMLIPIRLASGSPDTRWCSRVAGKLSLWHCWQAPLPAVLVRSQRVLGPMALYKTLASVRCHALAARYNTRLGRTQHENVRNTQELSYLLHTSMGGVAAFHEVAREKLWAR